MGRGSSPPSPHRVHGGFISGCGGGFVSFIYRLGNEVTHLPAKSTFGSKDRYWLDPNYSFSIVLKGSMYNVL